MSDIIIGLIGDNARGAQIGKRNEMNLGERSPLAGAQQLPDRPLLLICAESSTLCNSDRIALRRACVPFVRLLDATKRSIADELRRRRQNGDLYPWLHITAHAGPAGIMLSDGIAEPAWWHEQMDGVRLVFLAACKTSAVADMLAGLVTVVYVREDIDNQDAADFAYAFWRRMRAGSEPVAAYGAAIAEVPQVAEFTDIRKQ